MYRNRTLLKGQVSSLCDYTCVLIHCFFVVVLFFWSHSSIKFSAKTFSTICTSMYIFVVFRRGHVLKRQCFFQKDPLNSEHRPFFQCKGIGVSKFVLQTIFTKKCPIWFTSRNMWICIEQSSKIEQRHDKTNKMSVLPAKTQISICPSWSESSLGAHSFCFVKRRLNFLTLSCLNWHNIRSSLYTRLHDTRFWKTLGIFFNATLLPSLGSVTDLKHIINSCGLIKLF